MVKKRAAAAPASCSSSTSSSAITTSAAASSSAKASVSKNVNANAAAGAASKGPVATIRRPRKIGILMQYWIWYESSFAISMLENWEKIVLHVCGITLLSLFTYAVSRYLPRHIEFLGERAKFYLFGP